MSPTFIFTAPWQHLRLSLACDGVAVSGAATEFAERSWAGKNRNSPGAGKR